MVKFFRKLFEKLVEGLLLLSSTVTSFAIFLIIGFLFTEGRSLFSKSPVEQGFELLVHENNPVLELTPAQIKSVFDQEITQWSDLGSGTGEIMLFRIDDLGNYFSEEEMGENLEHVPACISRLLDSIPGLLAFVPQKFTPRIKKVKVISPGSFSVQDFLSGKEWYPTAQPVSVMGTLPLLLGTLWVSLGAILFALPLGLATAIYMGEIATPGIRKIMKPLVELLSGIPSVVYGFFGLVVLVPLVQKVFSLPVGETGLVGSIILGIMGLPTIITISEDAIRNTPNAMREASLALGANKWQTIYKVVIPYSMSGITAAAILGIGRAIGETMAVLMVTGNAAVIPHTLLEPVRTIPATIAAELGEAPQGGTHYQALFILGCMLFIITLSINLVVEFISSRRKF